ncbi:MAG: ubiquinone biosynthesis protein UbiB [Rhizobiales bacterium NRL2]|jgi:ubiquinone biosynthesis monooxygenase Coq7|nr:MAG: ubiquinone biosynthesis protein UbiB [Rhizobiales bacterium NRL2]
MRKPLPGDTPLEERIARIIRVDQAGEYGAKRIYDGQLAVLGGSRSVETIRQMADQELHHMETFDRIMNERHVRPTLLSPIWHVAGFALGAGTALMGEKAAMACTEAVEEVIDEHYAAQAAELDDDEAELRETIQRFRADELEHRDTARAHDAAGAPGYDLLTAGIKAGSRLAIWLSTRI